MQGFENDTKKPLKSSSSTNSSVSPEIMQMIPEFDPSRPPPNWLAKECSSCNSPKDVILRKIAEPSKTMTPAWSNAAKIEALSLEEVFLFHILLRKPDFNCLFQIQKSEMLKRDAKAKEKLNTMSKKSLSIFHTKSTQQVIQEIEKDMFHQGSIQQKRAQLFKNIAATNKTVTNKKKALKKVNETPVATSKIPATVGLCVAKKTKNSAKNVNECQEKKIKLEEEFDNWTKHMLEKVSADVDSKFD